MKRRRGRRCPAPHCRLPGRLTVHGARDFCIQHGYERDARAIREWTDPRTLRLIPYDEHDLTARPCGACGHPRWAHGIAGVFFDGPCLVLGCMACDGSVFSAQGYVPGVQA